MNLKTILIFIAVMVGVLAGVGGMLWQFGQAGDKPIADIAGEMRYKKGEASVTLVEFSDFQCPACLAVQEPLKQILTKYEGKVQFVYRHFPLSSIHKNAQMAAQASEAAYNQGKFWEMHDKLFITQANWQGIGDPREIFTKYAKELGMEEGKFVNDMESQTTKDVISTDLLTTTRYRLTGTPTFFINGIKIELPQIEAKLLELTK